MVDDEKVSQPDSLQDLQSPFQLAKEYLKSVCQSVVDDNGDLFAAESQSLIPFLRYSDTRKIFIDNLDDGDVTDLSLAAIQFANRSYVTQVILVEDKGGVSENAFSADREREEFCQLLVIYLEKLLVRFRTNPDHSESKLADALKSFWRGVTISDFPTILDDIDPGLFPFSTRLELIEISLATLGLTPFQRSYIEELVKANSSL